MGSGRRWVFWLVVGCVSGCGATKEIATPSRYYRLENQAAATVAFDARGRGAYLWVNATDKDHPLRFCAEPGPDVTADLSAQNRQSVDAGVKVQGYVDIKATTSNLEEAKSLARDLNAQTRTEGVLVLREAMYRLCELYVNGALDKDQAQRSYQKVLRLAGDLSQREAVARLLDTFAAKSRCPEKDADCRKAEAMAAASVPQQALLKAVTYVLAAEAVNRLDLPPDQAKSTFDALRTDLLRVENPVSGSAPVATPAQPMPVKQ